MDRHGNVKFVDVVNGKRDWKCASVVDATHLSVLYCSCLIIFCCLAHTLWWLMTVLSPQSVWNALFGFLSLFVVVI